MRIELIQAAVPTLRGYPTVTRLITSHERTDMDGLAAMYAASLLFPEHVPALPLKLNRNLQRFLALYKDEFPFVERATLQRRRVQELLLVDTQAIPPLKGMDARTTLHIIDHHAQRVETSERVAFEGRRTGATTTLLIERMRIADIVPGRLGLTLLLMGIYEDTGSLTYAVTTSDDAHAAAWLLEQGADLTLASQFLHHPLSPAQREVLGQLVADAQIHTIRGQAICIAQVRLDEYVDELSALVHQVMETYESDACLLLAEHRDEVQIIARSETDEVNVAQVLHTFGGGGHPRAAAARAESAHLPEVVAQLLQALEENVEPPTRVRELMSTSVHTLEPDMSIRDAAQLMRRYGHEGFPVVQGERLVGILTRSDVDRALHHRRGDQPLFSILHTGPLHVRPNDPIDTVQQVMIEHSLGQVPVVENGRFLGLVTRTDLIKLWTPAASPSRADEMRDLLAETLPSALRDLLIVARDTANEMGYSLYIVGGYVRDMLLGTPTLDLDMVVEGDAIAMAQKLAPQIGGRVRSHSRFGTAKVILDGDRPDGVPSALDFVTARTEFYERPSVLPQVERSSIKQDLYRRDFTINTMAICLDRTRFGELLDFYGGERDLRSKRIRVLHNLSFVEDPTRILRAVRFEQRLGFEIEDRTARLIDDAIELIDNVSGERIRHELYLMLNEDEPGRGLDRLSRLGVLERIHPALRVTRAMLPLFERVRGRFGEWADRWPAEVHALERDADDPHPSALALCYLALLTSCLGEEALQALIARLRISGPEATFLRNVTALLDSARELEAAAMLPSSLYRHLSPYSQEARFVLSVLTESEIVRARVDHYEHHLARCRPAVDGHYLRELGVAPGAIYREIIERIRDALLDGQIRTVTEQQQMAQQLAQSARQRPPSA